MAFSVGANAQNNTSTPQLISSSGADTWSFTDDLGRSRPKVNDGIHSDKYVGIFYFIWQGAHGYDQHGGEKANEGVMEKGPADTLSPYDNTRLIAANPDNPAFGPNHAWHYWGEPYFGYYLPDDEWIIRKHAQMLSDAGVDVIILDATNAHIYLPQVTKLATVYKKMREEGLSTPGFCFIVNSNPEKTVARLYEQLYSKGLFNDLWFVWKGKPLLLCPPEAVTKEIENFFSIRQSWAWSKGQNWFADGKDKWTWLDHTPQSYGWHEDPQKPEQISVSTAEHPVSNIGRSHHDGIQPTADSIDPTRGTYFNEQWQRALQVDPEFVFITGWNEWVAMRFTDDKAKKFLGKKIEKGDTYFVDQYNAEFSRDIEPENGLLKDDYYYQMVNYIRQYKGARAPAVSAGNTRIIIDGNFNDWNMIQQVYKDDNGDTTHRDHPGWGRIKSYTNFSGRNDIIESKVANDAKNISFFIKTSTPLSSSADDNWMILYLQTDTNSKNWEGFQYRINQKRSARNKASIERSLGGWNWQEVGFAELAIGKNAIEIKIPKDKIGLKEKEYSLNFKWVDNSVNDGDPMKFTDKGDAAPNGRFVYSFTHKN